MKSTRWWNPFAFLAVAFILLNALSAFAGPSRTTYQAKIVRPDGYPLEASSVNFKFTILDPAGSCILFSESYSAVNMTSTGGLISFSLGSGVKSFPVSGTTFEQVFSNITPNMGCDTGGGPPAVYTPLANDARKIVMQFNDGNGWQTLPAMNINAVPYAMYANDAMKFNGMAVSDFVQVSTIPTCAASEALRYTGTGFQCLAVGSSVSSGSVITALGYTPADGASVTVISSSLATTDANVASVSSTVFSVSSTVTSLQNSVTASLAAITSSQWNAAASGIYYDLGYVGIGTSAPAAALEINAPVSAAFTTQFKVTDGTTGGYFAVTEGSSTLPRYLPTFEYSSASVSGYGGVLVGKIPTAFDLTSVLGAAIVIDGRTASNTVLTNSNLLLVRNYTTPALVVQASGTVGIGTSTPMTKLDVAGGLRIGLESATCTAGLAGTLRYNAGVVEYCNGTTWVAFGVSGAGILAINGLTSGSQTFAFGSAGTAPNVSSTGTVHTFNFPFASVATTTAGVISYSDYLNFSNKQSATSAAITATLGYTPADAVSVTTLSSTVGSVSSTVNSVSSSVASLQNAMAASFGAITSSQWTTSGTNIFYSTGNVGIGTSNPTGRIDVQTTASNTLFYHINSSLTHTTTVSGGHNLVGVHSWLKPHIVSGATNTSTAYGVANRNIRNSIAGVDDSGVLNAMFGEHISFGHSNVGGASPTTNTMTGLYIDSQLGAGTVNSYTALRLASPSLSGASVGSRWGLAQDDVLARNYFLGNLGLGVTGPVARLHITAGTSSVAPVRFTAGTLLSPVQAGTMEYDGSNFYLTDDSGNRRVIAAGSASGTVDNATNLNSSSNITMTPTNSVIVSSTLTSTSSGTGALVVKGGVGVGGSLNVAGIVSSSAQVLATGFRANTGSPNNANNSTNGYAFFGDGDTGLFSSGTGILSLYNDNAESLRVLANGNIGIGTSAPSTALEVNGDITTTGGAGGLNIKAGSVDHAYIQYFARTASPTTRTAYLGFPTAGSNNFNIYNEAASGSIVFGLGLVERARISSAGVGIGIANPAAPLHVYGDNPNLVTIERSNNQNANILYKNTLYQMYAGMSPAGYFGVSANEDIGSSPGIVVTASQTVGLGGVTVPAATLDVLGAIRVGTAAATAGADMLYARYGSTSETTGVLGARYSSGGLFLGYGIQAGNSVTVPYLSSYDSTNMPRSVLHVGADIEFLTAAAQTTAPGLPVSMTQRMVVMSSGNVGIGVSNPGARLDVSNATSFLSNGTGANTYFRNSQTVDGDYLGIGWISENVWGISSADSGTYRSLTLQPYGGNIGIGTVSATYKVQINGNSISNGNPQTLVSAFTGNGLNIQGNVSNSSQDAITYQAGGSGGGAAMAFRRGGSYDTYIDFYTNNITSAGAITQAMTINNFGSVGIGTSSPSTLNGWQKVLDVHGSNHAKMVATQDSGSVSVTTGVYSHSLSGNGYGGYAQGYGGIGLVGTESNHDLGIMTNNIARISITKAGNVGIGTIAPAHSLAVNTNNAGGYTIISNKNSAAGGQEWRWYSSSTGAPLGSDSMCFGIGVCYFSLYTTGNATLAGTLTQSSDVRLKREIASIPYALDAVSKLDGVTYYWKDSSKEADKQIGLIAQEVEKVFPEAVKTNAQGYKSVAYQNLIAPVINAIKEIRDWLLKTDERIQVLEDARKQDKAAMDELKKQNETLKVYLCEKDPSATICK